RAVLAEHVGGGRNETALADIDGDRRPESGVADLVDRGDGSGSARVVEAGRGRGGILREDLLIAEVPDVRGARERDLPQVARDVRGDRDRAEGAVPVGEE